jgi:hypothetical protein
MIVVFTNQVSGETGGRRSVFSFESRWNTFSPFGSRGLRQTFTYRGLPGAGFAEATW